MEPRTFKTASLKSFLNLVLATRPSLPLLLTALGLSLGSTAVSLVVPLFTKSMVDGFSLSSLNFTQLALIGAAFALQAGAGSLSLYLLTLIGQRIVVGIRDRLWKKQLALPVRYFDSHGSGDLISRMVNDTAAVKALITENLSGFVSGIIAFVGASCLLLFLNWKMTLVMLVALPIGISALVPLGRTMRRVAMGTMNENAKFTAILAQVLSEIRLVKASNAEPREYRKGHATVERLYELGLKDGRIQALVGPLMSLVLMALLVLVVGYGGFLVSSGQLTAGALVAFILYLIQAIIPIAQITGFITQLQKARGATQSIIELLELPEEKPEEGLPLDSARQPIRFEQVSFSYVPGEPVCRDMSFTLEPDTVTAIVGPSGGGKTTLFNLLERFYEPDSGSIRIGSGSLDAFSLASWRSRLGYVPQDCPIMAGTIRENIIYGLDREPSEEEVIEAARMAYADGFIRELPRGYDTEVGERGVKLSGGQRQRIAIARALLRDPDVLMLDEATSSLDSASEHSVRLALQNLMRGRTTLVIAHRLSTVVDADRILFIEKGRLTGSGTHSELLASHELYRTFAERQLSLTDRAEALASPAA
ncbi:ABC transporter ATP-binding protein [Hyalangium minutum]|uniref:Lipid A export ATP-binding/permease protein MsbA n=1 Tax=Hyalangium minutum TaxID=394096 RepID=A0A085WW66_9BACT|nr:ABC transporter ATP-binding protein [Hyalangium minutum]KFE71929.1 Lipid A export ATP-binding/permease protein MsbA [Hyalangium minutum]